MVRTKNKCELVVVKELEYKGYEVFRRGWPDLIAIDKKTGKTRFIEVKPVTKKLKPYQLRVKEVFEKNNLVYEVWYVEQIGEYIFVHQNKKPEIYGKPGRRKQKDLKKRLSEVERILRK